MIVGIVPAGAGAADADSFVSAPSVAAGVSAYCPLFTPNRNPGDYLGFDPGWTAYTPPANGKKWSYDRTLGQLSQIDLPLGSVLSADGMAHSVKDDVISTPPGAPADQDRYLVPPGATGAWSGYPRHIATWSAAASQWLFTAPLEGHLVYVASTSQIKKYDASAWVSANLASSGESTDDFSGTATDEFQYLTMQTLPLRAGKYLFDCSIRARVDRSARVGTVIVKVDGQEVARETVPETDFISYHSFTQLTFAQDGTHDVQFFYLSPHRRTSVLIDASKYRITSA